MTNKILEFHLSHHFLRQCWERKIDRAILYKVLPFINASRENKKLAIVMPEFLSKKGIVVKEKYCLVIVLCNKLLKTAYWCDHPNYLFKKEKQSEFQIIY